MLGRYLSFSFWILFLLTSIGLFVVRPWETKEIEQLDRDEESLPPPALARLGSLRFWDGGSIHGIAYSPDGKYLATSSFPRNLVLLGAQSGRTIRSFKGPALDDDGLNVVSLAFSPDSKFLVTACTDWDDGWSHHRHRLQLWNVATGEVVRTFPQTAEPSTRVAFSPDGKIIVDSSVHGPIRLWDAQTGNLIHVFNSLNAEELVSSIDFSPDSKILAAVQGGAIRFWDVTSGKACDQQGIPTGQFSSVAFSPDGTILAAAGGTGIRLYQASNLAELPRFVGKEGNVWQIAFSPDGKTLVSSGDEINGKDVTRLDISIWDVVSRKQLRKLSSENPTSRTFVLSPDGKTVASVGGLHSHYVHRWDTTTGAMRPSGGRLGKTEQVAFLADGKTVLLALGGPQLLGWTYGSSGDASPVELPSGAESCFLCSDRSTLAVTTKNGVLILQEISTGKELLRCPMEKNSKLLGINLDEKRAAVQEAGNHVALWDLRNGKVLQRVAGDAYCHGLSLDGRIVALGGLSGNRRECHVMDLETTKELCHWSVPDGGVCDIRTGVMSPDGRMILIDSIDSGTRVYEIATCQERFRLARVSQGIGSVAFSADGRMLAGEVFNGTVHLWDLHDGQELVVFHGHVAHISAVAFSADGSKLVSASEDSTALVWEIPAACRTPRSAAVDLGRQEANNLWDKLASRDAAQAYAALQQLAASPAEAVSLCRDRLFVSPKATTPAQIQRWIAQLDDEEFTVREKASENLERVEGEAEIALEKALKGDCSPEVRRRIEALLETLKGKQLSIRALRAVELLEQVGTPESVDLLRQLEKKTGDPAVRDDVRRSLGRLEVKRKTS